MYACSRALRIGMERRALRGDSLRLVACIESAEVIETLLIQLTAPEAGCAGTARAHVPVTADSNLANSNRSRGGSEVPALVRSVSYRTTLVLRCQRKSVRINGLPYLCCTVSGEFQDARDQTAIGAYLNGRTESGGRRASPRWRRL